MRASGRSAVAVLVGAVVVLGLTVAAAAERPDPAFSSVVRWWPAALAGLALCVGVVLFARAAVAAAQLGEGELTEGRPSPWLLVAGLGLVMVVLRLLPPSDEPLVTGDGGAAGPFELPSTDPSPAVDTVTAAPSLFALGVLAVIVAVVAGARMRARRRRTAGHGEAVPSALSVAVRRASADARTTNDPRLGVMLAFAALEEAFADRRAGRADSETQAAWIERLLVEHGAPPAPAQRLRARFEHARFAATTITASDHRAALADLEALLDAEPAP